MHRDGRMNTAMALPGLLCVGALALAGCSSEADPSATQSGALHLIGSREHRGCGGDDGGVSVSGDAGDAGDFVACQTDDDCAAVPLAGCCHNGWKTAVNREEVDAYDAANACHQPRPICPMYIVNDTRVAECNRASLQCEMVQIDQIACGGFIAHPHRCPAGYGCVYGHVPDVPGHCVANAD